MTRIVVLTFLFSVAISNALRMAEYRDTNIISPKAPPPFSATCHQFLNMQHGFQLFDTARSAGQAQEISDMSTDALAKSMIADAFEDIYVNKRWNKNNGSSLSGGGSITQTTEALCTLLHNVVLKAFESGNRSSVSVLDAPSGDWHWMQSCLRRIEADLPSYSTLNYQGVDVSETAVRLAETKRFNVQADFSRIKIAPFKRIDLATPGVLPTNGFDVIMSHDALQHNSHKDVRAILDNFNMASNLLIIDVDRAGMNEFDISSGSYRPVDITEPPYNLKPLCADKNDGDYAPIEWEWFGLFKLNGHS